jgi:N-acetylneuraminic acid mutarotase
MKKLILSLLSLIFFQIHAQTWTWMTGSDTLTQIGVYGTMGVSSPSNNPGSRHGAATWTDASGNLWLFGGEGLTTTTTLCWLNDMWKYDVGTNEWTWMRGTNLPNQNGIYGIQGVPSPTNEPGAREFMCTWTDAAGNFWMFGGDGFPATGGIGNLNDLWRYNPTTNEWTWMKGSSTLTNQNGIYGIKNVSASGNNPGGRIGPGSWTDNSGKLWMFGGFGYAASLPGGNLDDLWRYDPATNEWTWMHGTNLSNQFGNYGTKSVASSTNNPGGREFGNCLKDAAGDLWLFGGLGYPASTAAGHLNDLWKYNIASNSWTWISGSNVQNQLGNYGSQNIPAPTNLPGGRFASGTWVDPVGNFWVFGGSGYASGTFPGRLNDLWKYSPTTNEWSWEHGFNVFNMNGIYGSITVPAPFTTPGARYYNTWWKQNNGTFWLFGGLGFGAQGGGTNNLNDLWKFTTSCGPNNITPSSALVTCEGNSISITAISSATGTITWYNSSTATTSIGSGSVFITPTLTTPGSQTYYTYYAEASPCPDRTAITITVNSTPTVSIFSDNSLICAGSTITLTANGANTYTWNTSATGQFLSITPSVTTTYTVTGTDTSGCVGVGVLTQSVSACTGITSNIAETRTVRLYPNPNNGVFYLSPTVKEGEFALYNTLGQEVFKKELKGEIYLSVNIAKGIYYYFIQEKGLKVGNGKMVVE